MTRTSLALLLFACCAALAGCSIEAPTPLEEDPELRGLAAPADLGLRLAIAPVQLPHGPPAAAWPALESVAVPASRSVTWPEREYASDLVALDAPGLQRRLGRVSSWAVGGEEILLSADTPAGLLRQAEAEGADLLVQLDLLRARSSWVGRDGLWWWGDLFLFWGIGVAPVLFVSDEVYALDLEARLQVVEVRSGRALLTRTFSAGYARSLNHPQRGWSVGGLLWLHPYTLDEEDLAQAGASLLPHARKELERRAATYLQQDLSRPLRALLPEIRSGALGPRLHALAIGVNGPGSEWDFDRPAPLQGAEADAERFAACLARGGAKVRTLTGPAATQASIEAAASEISTQMRASDRLVIYFAGYGRTDREGLPALIAARGPLRLREFCDRLAARLPAGARVDLVLDASFGRRGGGRTYPGGAALARGSLGVLVKDRPWRLLCAARPEETAIERSAPERGLFTEWLLTFAAGAGDANADGELSLREAWSFLNRWVSAEAQEAGSLQQPCIWGSEIDAPFLPMAPQVEAPPALEEELPAPLEGTREDAGGPGGASEEEPLAPTPAAPIPTAPSLAPPAAPDDSAPGD